MDVTNRGKASPERTILRVRVGGGGRQAAGPSIGRQERGSRGRSRHRKGASRLRDQQQRGSFYRRERKEPKNWRDNDGTKGRRLFHPQISQISADVIGRVADAARRPVPPLSSSPVASVRRASLRRDRGPRGDPIPLRGTARGSVRLRHFGGFIIRRHPEHPWRRPTGD